MQVLQRKRCQTRTRPRKKACVYGGRVSGATIYSYVWNNPLVMFDPTGFEGVASSYNYQGYSGTLDKSAGIEFKAITLPKGHDERTSTSQSTRDSNSAYIANKRAEEATVNAYFTQVDPNGYPLGTNPLAPYAPKMVAAGGLTFGIGVAGAYGLGQLGLGLWGLHEFGETGLPPLPPLTRTAAKEAAAVTEISFGVKATKNSATQLNVNLTQTQAIDNLAANGFSKTVSKDGTVTIMSNGDKTYRFYPSSTGGGVAGAESGVPSASVSVMDKIITKLRFWGE